MNKRTKWFFFFIDFFLLKLFNYSRKVSKMEILLIAAVLPVIALCYYIYKKDKNGEPHDMLRKLFIFYFSIIHFL